MSDFKLNHFNDTILVQVSGAAMKNIDQQITSPHIIEPNFEKEFIVQSLEFKLVDGEEEALETAETIEGLEDLGLQEIEPLAGTQKVIEKDALVEMPDSPAEQAEAVFQSLGEAIFITSEGGDNQISIGSGFSTASGMGSVFMSDSDYTVSHFSHNGNSDFDHYQPLSNDPDFLLYAEPLFDVNDLPIPGDDNDDDSGSSSNDDGNGPGGVASGPDDGSGGNGSNDDGGNGDGGHGASAGAGDGGGNDDSASDDSIIGGDYDDEDQDQDGDENHDEDDGASEYVNLYDTAGSDVLYGTSNDDFMSFGEGSDIVAGGGGQDVFVNSYGIDHNTDYFTDFEFGKGGDVLVLHNIINEFDAQKDMLNDLVRLQDHADGGSSLYVREGEDYVELINFTNGSQGKDIYDMVNDGNLVLLDFYN